ncbi:DUF6049 family protein [Williamsia sterculiae]|uniref:DUF6049 family protein n=1 Tax=Williamsia sterculiae TaxID=1344003 RepID=UPI00117D8958|nr:DUF6049 family protein [Williamsia sterculiae]
MAVVLLVVLLGWLPAGLPRAAAAPGALNSTFLSVQVGSLTPSTVTTTSPDTVTVAGDIRNVGDRPVRDISVRLQRAPAVNTAPGLRAALARDASTFDVTTPFVSIPGTLAAGQQVSFRLQVPLSDGGLRIDTPGVFPLLVNVNGTPDYGQQARLDDSRTMLSVLGLPPDKARAETVAQDSTADDSDTGDSAADGSSATPMTNGSIAPDTRSPSDFTMLWPLSATPQLAAGVPGGGDQPVRLISDSLAGSLSNGRLAGLLSAVDDATADADSKLSRSLCLAVDPDLLVTVQAMTGDYEVTTDPTDPRAPTRAGTGSAAAKTWLDRLRRVADRLCVVATPFAQVSPDALARVGDVGLTGAGLSAPADIVDAVLGVRSVRGLTLPPNGVLTAAAATMLGKGAKAVVAQSTVTTDDPAAEGRFRIGDDTVATYDPAVTTALAALGRAPATPALTRANQRFPLDDESAVSRRAAATAALAYSPLIPSDTAADADPARQSAAGRSELVVPPPIWDATGDDAAAVLDTASMLVESGVANPRSLPDLSDALSRTTTTGRSVLPPDTTVGGTYVSTGTVNTVRGVTDRTWQLQGSMVQRSDADLSPQTYLAPLHEDMLRAMHTNPEGTVADVQTGAAASQARLTATTATLSAMRASVSILDPGGGYTLASERSPLLLVIRNDLPVPIRTRLSTSAPEELKIDDAGVIEVPPRGTRQIQVPATANSSRSVRVNMSLSTTTGVTLGSGVSLSVHSNAYGKPLFWITVVAGVLLVLLSGRRLWRRFRGRPDPADLDRPEPDERERMMAQSHFHHSSRRPPLDDVVLLPGEAPDTAGSRSSSGAARPHPTEGSDS